MNALINHVTKESFEEEIVKSHLPVLIDFWAEWCGPCRVVAPVLDEIATEYEGKIKVVKVNTDEQPELADQFNITTIPTVLLYHNENEVSRTVGAHPKENIEAFIDEHVL